MASIREREPGVWQVRSYSGRVDGKPTYVTKTFRGTEKQATAFGKAQDVDVARGLHRTDGSTVAGYMARWLEFHGPHLSPTTLRGYERNVRVHIVPALGKKRVSDVKIRDLDDLYSTLLHRKGLDPKTIRQVHAILHKAFSQAVKWGVLVANPATGASPPPVRRREIEPPTPADVNRVLAALAERPSLELFVRLAVTTGARRGELCGLRWSDFDPDEGTLTVSRSIVELAGNRVLVKGTKTDRVKRIGLDPKTAAMFVAEQQRRRDLARKSRVRLVKDPYVFPNDVSHSEPWRPDYASRAWRRWADKEKLPNVRLHDCRHFVASEMMAAGVDPRTVAGRLGHATPSMTLNVYGHFAPAKDAEAAVGLAGLLDGAGTGDSGEEASTTPT